MAEQMHSRGRRKIKRVKGSPPPGKGLHHKEQVCASPIPHLQEKNKNTSTPTSELSNTPTSELTSTPTSELTSTPASELTSTPAGKLTSTPTSELTSTPTSELTSTSTSELSGAPTSELSSRSSININPSFYYTKERERLTISVFIFLMENVNKLPSITREIFSYDIEKVGFNLGGFRSAIRNLIKEGFIERKIFKKGMGGWTIYELHCGLIHEVCINNKRVSRKWNKVVKTIKSS